MIERDFNYFVETYGIKGASEKFEGACYNVLKHKFPETNVKRIRENPGDDGIDIYVGDIDQRIDVYQCKFYINDLHYNSIDNSLEKAVKNINYKLNEWYLIIPKRLDIKEDIKWSKWKEKKEKLYSIIIHLIDKDEIILMMKKFKIYEQIFNINEAIQLEYVYNIALKGSSEIKENMDFMISKVITYVNKRLELIKDLYRNIYHVKEYLKSGKYNSFQDIFNNVNIEERFLFQEIDSILKKIENHDVELSYLCREYIFFEQIYIADIEKNIQYTDEYLFSIQNTVFEKILLNIIVELEKEISRINDIIKHKYTDTKLINDKMTELNDCIIVYKNNKVEMLANHLVNMINSNSLESYDIFYGTKDKEALEIGAVFMNTLYSNARIPYSSDKYKLIEYIDKKNTKFNDTGKYWFHLDTNNIIFLDELDYKTIKKLEKIKCTANIKYHFFIGNDKIDTFIRKNQLNIDDFKIIEDFYYIIDEKKIKDEMNKLLQYKISDIPDELYIIHKEDQTIISNGFGFTIRKKNSK